VAHLYVARSMARAGRLDQALVEYMETARGRPTLVPLVAGEVVGLTDGFEQARLLARLPEDELLVYEALAEAYIRVNLPEEARRADVAALLVDPHAPIPLKRSIRRHIDAELWPEARTLARKLATVKDYEATALALEGEIDWRTGHPDRALELYEAALKIDPRKREILLQIARLHYDAENPDGLFETLGRYQASAGDEAARGDAIAKRGYYQQKLGMENQALSSYIEASSSIPDDGGVWKAIAHIYEKRGDPVAALEAYRELARIEPENQVWQQKVDAIVIEAKTRAIMP
jgi:tetratricopeptide (TPR) repeat protein